MAKPVAHARPVVNEALLSQTAVKLHLIIHLNVMFFGKLSSSIGGSINKKNKFLHQKAGSLNSSHISISWNIFWSVS